MIRIFALAVAIAAASPALAADRMTLLLDWYVNPDHGPVIIAREKGYFADAGLDVEIIAPADPVRPAEDGSCRQGGPRHLLPAADPPPGGGRPAPEARWNACGNAA